MTEVEVGQEVVLIQPDGFLVVEDGFLRSPLVVQDIAKVGVGRGV